jgi:hypothetical protein
MVMLGRGALGCFFFFDVNVIPVYWSCLMRRLRNQYPHSGSQRPWCWWVRRSRDGCTSQRRPPKNIAGRVDAAGITESRGWYRYPDIDIIRLDIDIITSYPRPLKGRSAVAAATPQSI